MERKKFIEQFIPSCDLPIFPELEPFIKDGTKSVDVRIAYPNNLVTRIGVGTIIRFNHNEELKRLVNRLGIYQSFEELLQNVDSQAIYPGIEARDLLKGLRRLFPAHKERFGIRAFGLQKIDTDFK